MVWREYFNQPLMEDVLLYDPVPYVPFPLGSFLVLVTQGESWESPRCLKDNQGQEPRGERARWVRICSDPKGVAVSV